MTQTQSSPTDATAPEEAAPQRFDLQRLVKGYFWVIFKNVLGWTFIISAPILGIAVPGPGGIPVFLIGFALVTLPGKRRLTSHFMRGRRLPIESPVFTGLITFFSVAVTATLMILVWHYYGVIGDRLPLQDWGLDRLARLLSISLVALPVTMGISWIGLKILNGVLRWIPRLRRMIRPTLRKWGVRLLPTRRKRIGGETMLVHDEILELDESQRQRLARMWVRLGPWFKRLAAVSLTVAIIYLVVAPVLNEWHSVEQRIGTVNLMRIATAVGMYAVGLLVFRTVAWQAMLKAFGHPIPARPAARIWALGHLARYIPGRTYQVLRMELARPYGPTGVQAGVATRLEGTLTLFAAILVGLAAFWTVGWLRLDPAWRPLLVAVAAFSPAVLVLAVPRIFYRVLPPTTGVWRRGHGETRLHGGRLLVLLVWLLAGVLWQALAIWLLVGPPLETSGRWWLIAGAWAVAWAAGHLAPWSPGGIGVREVVFVAVLSVLLPPQIRESFRISMPFDLLQPESWQDAYWAFLFFLSLLLRLATTAAEFLLAVTATAADWRGMLDAARDTNGR